MLHGGRYRYADIGEATGQSRKTLYRVRHALRFGKRGVFTYGESLAMVFTHLANVHVNNDGVCIALRAMAHDIDALPNATHVVLYQHNIGDTWTPHVCVGDYHHNGMAFAIVGDVRALALVLAHAHARVHTPNGEHTQVPSGLAHVGVETTKPHGTRATSSV